MDRTRRGAAGFEHTRAGQMRPQPLKGFSNRKKLAGGGPGFRGLNQQNTSGPVPDPEGSWFFDQLQFEDTSQVYIV